MSVKVLTEYHLEFLSLKGDYTGSSESALVKMRHFGNHMERLKRNATIIDQSLPMPTRGSNERTNYIYKGHLIKRDLGVVLYIPKVTINCEVCNNISIQSKVICCLAMTNCSKSNICWAY